MSQEFELTEELLQRYYDGELDERERLRVEKALAQDSAGRESIAELAAVSQAMAALASECEPSEVTARNTWQRIDRRNRRYRHARRAGWWAGAVAAAAVLAGVYLLPPAGSETPPPHPLQI